MLESVDVGNKEHQNTVSYGDILMSQSSETVEEVGLSSVYLYDDEPYLNSFCFGFSLNDLNMTYPQYMGYLMRSDAVRKQIMREGQGISRINLSPNRIRNIKLSIPCLEEQQKIADCLSSVDAVITDYEAQVDNMQNQKKGVMQKLFSQEVRFKADDGSEYPEWAIVNLESICEKLKAGGTPKSTNRDYYGGDIPFLSISDMTKAGKHVSRTEKSLTALGLKNSSAWLVPMSSIILSMYASYGKVCICNTEMATSQAMISIVLNDKASTEFLYQLLSYMDAAGYWKPFVKTGTQANITAETVRSAKIGLPCLEEQQKIADCLSAFDEAIEDLQKTVEHWKNIKKGLLQQLFAWEA